MNSQYNQRLIRLQDIVRPIAPRLPYHNMIHILDVAHSVENYGRLENQSEHSIYLLKCAALLHDAFYVPGRNDNEEKSVEISDKILPQLNVAPGDIPQINGLILATKMPTNPKGILEMIICDSDIDNLGRDDYFDWCEKYRIECASDRKYWYGEFQPAFLKTVKYHTPSAQSLRYPGIQQNLDRLADLKI